MSHEGMRSLYWHEGNGVVAQYHPLQLHTPQHQQNKAEKSSLRQHTGVPQ